MWKPAKPESPIRPWVGVRGERIGVGKDGGADPEGLTPRHKGTKFRGRDLHRRGGKLAEGDGDRGVQRRVLKGAERDGKRGPDCRREKAQKAQKGTV